MVQTAAERERKSQSPGFDRGDERMAIEDALELMRDPSATTSGRVR